ncbi:MAG TPA: response regulator, partial [Pilimelia sp.]|nr:response regulator [Pilimelia sp.]
YAAGLNSRYVTALPLTVPPDSTGALLIFNRHRSLFSEDDLRLLADIGAQAGILAERGAVIAEQRRLADELAASVTALTKASEAKSDFLANMSHELRTPLNAIIGFSDLMRGEQPSDDQRTVPAEWVDHIHTSGRHLLGLINDVLDLAKVEAGRLDLQPVPVRIDTAAQDLLTALRPLVDRQNLTTRIDIPPMVANVDPVRFRQILENLLSNAIKFTPAGGQITVTGAALDGDVSVTVADTGVGIAGADQTRVFEEFQQVGDAAQRSAGTGLGLALTRRLVQAHGGDITLESALGRGSRFTVRLPSAVPAGTARPPAPPGQPAPPTATRGHVLLIEDDLRAAELVRTYLRHAGYRVDVAGSGEAGIASARRDPPDAVLLDVVLPGIPGWDVLRQLKADSRLARIPVFLVTVIDERRTGAAMGATEYFVKPVDHAELLAALARHVLPPTSRPEVGAVLLVDDDAEVRAQVADSLRAAGAEVVACGDGRRGLELTRDRRFDLIVCDVGMPDEDGFALLAALREDPATRRTPVLMSLSGGAPGAADLTEEPVP